MTRSQNRWRLERRYHGPQIVMLIALAALPGWADQTCPEYAAMIEAVAPPEVGTSTLVSQMLAVQVPVTDGLSQRFDPKAARIALDSRVRRGPACPRGKQAGAAPWACEFRDQRDTQAVLRIDLREGYLAFIDPTRSHDPDGPAYQVSEEEAAAVADSLIEPLGIAPGEVDPQGPHIWARTSFSGLQGQRATQQRRSELNVDIFRRIGGRRVFGSRLRVAVDGQRRPARVHLDWPDFRIAGGLTPNNALTRSEVVGLAVEAIGEQAPCSLFRGVTAMIAWVESDELGFIDRSDEAQPTSSRGYVPALVVGARAALDNEPLPPGQRYKPHSIVVAVPLVGQGRSADE